MTVEPDDRNCIAIIGGGFSGIVTAWRLSRSARFGGRIVLIEGPRPFGAAYATDSPWHVLNTPAVQMSALPETPDHFLRFANRHAGPCAERAYLPRRLYRSYLACLLDEAGARGVLRWATSVTAVRRGRNEPFRIDCANGACLNADRIVLAVGAAAPAVPRVLAGLAGTRGFFADPWAAQACRPAQDSAPIALVGTGQTAVDVALELVRQGHRGPIVAVSRHGLLPGVHAQAAARTALYPIDIEQMPIHSAVAVQRWWRRHVAACADPCAAYAALRPHTTRCWQRLPVDVRSRLLRHARAYWDVDRHRLAPEVADRLSRVLRSGRLRVRAARILAGAATPRGIELTLRPRGKSGRVASQRFARVINCTGFDGGSMSPLIQQLRTAGLVSPAAHGLGVDVRIDAGNGIDLIGALQRGRDWESTAVPELARRCAEVVRDIEVGMLQRRSSVSGAVRSGSRERPANRAL